MTAGAVERQRQREEAERARDVAVKTSRSAAGRTNKHAAGDRVAVWWPRKGDDSRGMWFEGTIKNVEEEIGAKFAIVAKYQIQYDDGQLAPCDPHNESICFIWQRDLIKQLGKLLAPRVLAGAPSPARRGTAAPAPISSRSVNSPTAVRLFGASETEEPSNAVLPQSPLRRSQASAASHVRSTGEIGRSGSARGAKSGLIDLQSSGSEDNGGNDGDEHGDENDRVIFDGETKQESGKEVHVKEEAAMEGKDGELRAKQSRDAGKEALRVFEAQNAQALAEEKSAQALAEARSAQELAAERAAVAEGRANNVEARMAAAEARAAAAEELVDTLRASPPEVANMTNTGNDETRADDTVVKDDAMFTRRFLAFRQYLKIQERSATGKKDQRRSRWAMKIHRDTLVDDVLAEFGKIGRRRLYSDPLVTFLDRHDNKEEGDDGGGLTAEMYSSLWRKVLLPEAGLFERDEDEDGGVYLPLADAPQDQLRALGVVLAKMLIDEHPTGQGVCPFLFDYLVHGSECAALLEPAAALRAFRSFSPKMTDTWERLLQREPGMLENYEGISVNEFSDGVVYTEGDDHETVSVDNVARAVLNGCRYRLFDKRSEALKAMREGFLQYEDLELQLQAMTSAEFGCMLRGTVSLSGEELCAEIAPVDIDFEDHENVVSVMP